MERSKNITKAHPKTLQTLQYSYQKNISENKLQAVCSPFNQKKIALYFTTLLNFSIIKNKKLNKRRKTSHENIFGE